MNLTRRPRRLRRTAQIREMVHEVDVRCDDLIYPVFVTEGENVQSPIESMPGIYHYSLDRLAIHLKEVFHLFGWNMILLFRDLIFFLNR